MGFLKSLQSFAAVMLTKPEWDPYKEPYQKPRVTGSYVDENGNKHITVYAQNYRDADMWKGTTPQGDVSRVISRTGHNTWDVTNEPWDWDFSDKE